MSDFTLNTVARLQVAKQTVRDAMVTGARRAAERFRREQTGQDVLEYSGLIVFVAIVIGLLFTIQVPQNIGTAMANGFNAAFQPHHHYTAPAPLTVSTTANGG
jgi:Flp pilus assembly pilin Flp